MSVEHEVMLEIHKVEHIFSELGREYQFAICERSKLPILIIAPNESNGLFLPQAGWTPDVQRLYMQLQTRNALQLRDIPMAESIAHTLRGCAMLEANADRRTEILDRAYSLYRSILSQCAHTSLATVVDDIPKMSTKIVFVSPPPDLHAVPTEVRRLAAHCLGGMAFCALVGKRNPILFFGLTSAATGWEPIRALEMANFMRVNLLLVGMFHLGLVKIKQDGEFVTMCKETVDALIGSSLMSIPAVYMTMTKMLILPLVLRHGSATMLANEKELIPPEDWNEVWCFSPLQRAPH